MTTTIAHYEGGEFDRVPWTSRRQIDRVHGQGRIQRASIREKALAHAERIHAIAYVAAVAQHRVAQLSAVEGELIKLCPLAEPRLRAIGDAACLAMTGVVKEMS